MIVSVIGNCQSESLAKCLMAMNHGLHADVHIVHEITADPIKLRQVIETSAHVFAQIGVRPHIPADLAHKVIYFPSIAFSGYHPDLTFARGRRPGGAVEMVSNALSGYHSAIALFGFIHGINIEDILTFYHARVYGQLGYFDAWEDARRQLLAEGEQCGMPLHGLLEKWSRGEAFMYSSNHPTLVVMEDIARELLRRIGVSRVTDTVHELLVDPLKAMPIWPKYPEIAERLGLHGSMAFKLHEPHGALSLREFVTGCYEIYADFEPGSIEVLNVPVDQFAQRLGFVADPPIKPLIRNPYAGAPKVQFWKNAVAAIAPENLDPVVNPRFAIGIDDKVATAGSCFAQHIARTLNASGFNYFVPEQAPKYMTPEESHAHNFGVFSARFGNIYTVRQLLQLIDRIDNRFQPRDTAWVGSSGGYVDPFRPQIEPDGFPTVDALNLSRESHFAAVRQMFREMDYFIFTFGLTEGWRSRVDGAVFPLAPGVAGGKMDLDDYEFINFDVDSIRADTHEVIARIKAFNPDCRIILTVSPVPLIATYEPRHALVSTTYSKAVLRVVADEMWRCYDHVDYFPSYEIITGSYNRGAYFGGDLREVREEGVAHVMRTFMRHYANGTESPVESVAQDVPDTPRNAFFDIVCDEEAIARF